MMFFFLMSMIILSGPFSALAAKKVVHIWHTEPNPLTVGVMKEIIADFTQRNSLDHYAPPDGGNGTNGYTTTTFRPLRLALATCVSLRR